MARPLGFNFKIFLIAATILTFAFQLATNLAAFEIFDLGILSVVGMQVAVMSMQVVLLGVFAFSAYYSATRLSTLPDQSQLFRNAIETARNGVAFIDPRGALTYANSSFLRQFHLTEAVFGNVRFADLIDPFLVKSEQKALFPQQPSEQQLCMLRPTEKGAAALRMQMRKLPHRGSGWVAMVYSRLQDQAAAITDIISTAVPNMAMDAILLINTSEASSPIIFANPAFQDMIGRSLAEIIGQNYQAVLANESCKLEPLIRVALEDDKPAFETIRLARQDGSMFVADIRVAPVRYRSDKILDRAGSVVVVIRDVSELRSLETALGRRKMFDTLTGLVNGDTFMEQLTARSDLAGTGQIMLALIELACFDELSATLGAGVCDRLLQVVAELLNSVPGAFVARTGTSEFAVALPVADRDAAVSESARLFAILDKIHTLPGARLGVKVLIGTTVGPVRAIDGHRLMRECRAALWRARQPGVSSSQMFNAAIDAAINQRVSLSQDLRQAISEREFELRYHPHIDLATGAVVGAEIMPLWCHPVFGPQEPKSFMPIAEDIGLTIEIGQWVMLEAARFATSTNERRSIPLRFFLKISSLQLQDLHFLERLERAMAQGRAQPEWFILELPKTIFDQPIADCLALLLRLRRHGFRLALENFDAVCAGLRYLNRMPVSAMIIGEGIVGDLENHSYCQTMVRAACEIARDLGVQVIARGIGTESERTILRDLGCSIGGGRLFGAPMSNSDFNAMAENPASSLATNDRACDEATVGTNALTPIREPALPSPG